MYKINDVTMRGKHKDDWINGYLRVYPGVAGGITASIVDISTGEEKNVSLYGISRYIGVRDKHNKKIFEGDIIRIDNSNEFYEVLYVAKYAAYLLYNSSDNNSKMFKPEILSHIEIVGNIYDN